MTSSQLILDILEEELASKEFSLEDLSPGYQYRVYPPYGKMNEVLRNFSSIKTWSASLYITRWKQRFEVGFSWLKTHHHYEDGERRLAEYDSFKTFVDNPEFPNNVLNCISNAWEEYCGNSNNWIKWDIVKTF